MSIDNPQGTLQKENHPLAMKSLPFPAPGIVRLLKIPTCYTQDIIEIAKREMTPVLPLGWICPTVNNLL